MIRKVFLRTAYNYDMNEAGDETGLACRDKSLAQQCFAEECDINTIVKRFGVGYEMPEGVVAPTYQDFEGIFDFHTAMIAITDAREAFGSLPAEVRYRFHNDPGEFVQFCSDGANRAEAEKLGLVVPPPPVKEEKPLKVTVVAPEGVPEGT